MKNEFVEELMRVLKTSQNPLTTQEILQRVKDKCPDASMTMLVELMDQGIVVGQWAAGKGYLWTLAPCNQP
jgi:hypothetical protein